LPWQYELISSKYTSVKAPHKCEALTLVSLPANGWNSFYESLEIIDKRLEKAGLVILDGQVVLEDRDV
jgi:hypothetical protein